MPERSTLDILRTCRFTVTCSQFPEDTAYFTEISGFDATYDPVEYRAGDDSRMTPMKFPGLIKYGDITLKRGIASTEVLGESSFLNWIDKSRDGAIVKLDQMTISLLNNEGTEPAATWELRQVWPSKYEGPSLNGNSSEVAIETLTLCHEGLTRTK